MSSIDQGVSRSRVQCATRVTRRVRWLFAAAAVAVLAAACSLPPRSVEVNTGSVLSGSVSSLRSDDDDYYTVGATCNGNFGGCVAEWTATFQTGATDSDGSYAVRYTGKNAGAGLQFITVFNWGTWSWYPIDAFHVVATSEQTVTATLPGRGWLLPVPGGGSIAVVRVTTIGDLTSTSGDFLAGCLTTSC